MKRAGSRSASRPCPNCAESCAIRTRVPETGQGSATTRAQRAGGKQPRRARFLRFGAQIGLLVALLEVLPNDASDNSQDRNVAVENDGFRHGEEPYKSDFSLRNMNQRQLATVPWHPHTCIIFAVRCSET